MLQTPKNAKPERRALSKASVEKTSSGMDPVHAPAYRGLPAKYFGIPNFLQYRIGPCADLQNAALSHADLRWNNFRGANLRGAQLSESILWGSTLTNANLQGANLCQADFTGADLIGADLTNAVCEGACFLGARYDQSTRFPKGFKPESRGMVSHNSSLQIC